MSYTLAKRTIQAPVDKVFDTIADVRNFKKAVPGILDVEFLTDSTRGVGTRFKETRDMNGRRATTELECTEYAENAKVRMVSDAGGTIWDTVFEVRPQGSTTELELRMDARPYKLLPRLMNPLIRGMVSKAVVSDLDAVKRYCEES